ncbi:MAG: hypothetical protein RIT81_17675 [Deltaproteobacteria bacterium]
MTTTTQRTHSDVGRWTQSVFDRVRQTLDALDGVPLEARVLALVETHLSAIADAMSRVGPATSWIVVDLVHRSVRRPNGETVPLHRRRAPWLVFRRLAEARVEAPGVPVDREALVEAGWPDEIIHPTAAAARVYFVIRQLRVVGLEDVVATGAGGYLIPVDTEVILEAPERTGVASQASPVGEGRGPRFGPHLA